MARRFVAIGECMIEMSGGAGGSWQLGYAGDTFNTAWYFRKITDPGDWAVDYLTCLGDDSYSDGMAEFIAAAGIGTGHIRRLPGKRPGLYMIHQEDGDRRFTYWRDTAAAKCLADDTDALEAALSDADLAYLSGITVAILSDAARARLLAAVKASDATVAFDPNIRPHLWPHREAMRAGLMEAAEVADIVLPSFDDEAVTFGDASLEATAARYKAREVAVKNAGAAVLVREGEILEMVEPGPKVEALDATAAGDSFSAGYLAARLQGLAPGDAVRAAHELAALVVQHRGALVPEDALPPKTSFR